MKALLAALLCGALFGAGLVVSDMINPARVLAFLDLAGDWDPSLGLVMGGALLPAALAYWLRARRAAPLLQPRFLTPEGGGIDRPLLAGAVLFGLGWGLVGLCPGPALAALLVAGPGALVFVLAMLAGMLVHHLGFGRART